MAKILLIEDQLLWQRTLPKLLQQEGHEVVVAGSYEKAQTYITEIEDIGSTFDLILLDLILEDWGSELEGKNLLSLIDGRDKSGRAKIIIFIEEEADKDTIEATRDILIHYKGLIVDFYDKKKFADGKAFLELIQKTLIKSPDISVFWGQLNASESKEIFEEIHEATRKAIAFIDQKVVYKNELVGWPHYLGSETIGVIGTAMGVLCYLHAEVDSPIIMKGLKTLKTFQNSDGGWPVRTLIGGSCISVTESTLFCLWALLKGGFHPNDESVVKAIGWLEKAHKKSGGWGSSIESTRARVFPTAFAVRILSKIEQAGNLVKNGISWLQNARNSDGGWSTFSVESDDSGKSTAIHSAHSIIALLSGGFDRESDIIRNGIEWILSNYSEDIEEGWESTSEVEFVEVESAIDYRHYTTPWCLIAITRSSFPLFGKAVLRVCERLVLKQHEHGYWVHKLAPGHTPIWATHDCLLALNEVASAVSPYDEPQ